MYIVITWYWPTLHITHTIQVSDFTALVAELRRATDAAGMLLTSALKASSTPNLYYELDKVAPLFDFINLMSYDFHGGSWEEGPANFHAPIVDCYAEKENFDIHGM